MRSYRVGIIGFGFIGKVHAFAHHTLPYYYDPAPCRTVITHVCTSKPETAEKARAQLGAEVATTDYREITENRAVDIVHVCTPNHLHRDQLLSALGQDKHIYCDKPLAADLAEAAEIEEALKHYRGIGQMTFQNRFYPPVIRAKALIDVGFLGKVLEFRASYLHSGSADPETPLKWKLSAAAGGGVIADLGSHILDLMHYLLGDFASLCAATTIAYPDRPSSVDPAVRRKVDAEDSFQVLVRTRSGAAGVIEASKLATGTEDELRFEIHGSPGALRFNSLDPHHLEAYDARNPDSPVGGWRGWTKIDTGQRYPKPAGFPGPKFSMGWMRTHVACLANFLQSVASDTPAQPDLTQGVTVQRLMASVRASAETGNWVDL